MAETERRDASQLGQPADEASEIAGKGILIGTVSWSDAVQPGASCAPASGTSQHSPRRATTGEFRLRGGQA